MTRSGGKIAGWLASLLRQSGEKAHNGRELDELRRRLGELENRLQRIAEDGDKASAPVIVEQIRIDKVVVDKIEYHNNFGALGIKELKGKLNIGANYTLTEDELPDEAKEGLQAFADIRENQSQGNYTAKNKSTLGAEAEPKVRIRAKR